jgi:hypothetical protein
MYSHPMKYARDYEDLYSLSNYNNVYDVIYNSVQEPLFVCMLEGESDRKTVMVVTHVQAQHPSSVGTAFPSLVPLHDCQQWVSIQLRKLII